MRRLRPRFKVRTMMILVALIGVASLGGREIWRHWLRQDYRNPIFPSFVAAQIHSTEGFHVVANPDQPVPVSITYDFKFGPVKPPPGFTCELFAAVWLEDLATRQAVETYTFDSRLTAGKRDSASGTFIWEPSMPHAGRYYLRSFLYWKTPTGELRGSSGSGRLYIIGPHQGTSQAGFGDVQFLN